MGGCISKIEPEDNYVTLHNERISVDVPVHIPVYTSIYTTKPIMKPITKPITKYRKSISEN
jgi:hypothetical protein